MKTRTSRCSAEDSFAVRQTRVTSQLCHLLAVWKTPINYRNVFCFVFSFGGWGWVRDQAVTMAVAWGGVGGRADRFNEILCTSYALSFLPIKMEIQTRAPQTSDGGVVCNSDSQ